MITTKIGENAGLIWNALEGGALTFKALKKATKLKNDELYLALGWLAREGKVSFTEGEDLTITLLYLLFLRLSNLCWQPYFNRKIRTIHGQ